MTKVPGTFSNGSHGIPPNLEWDAVNPPQRYSCSGLVNQHADNCDGTCLAASLDEIETELVNEHRNWARLGIDKKMLDVDQFKLVCQVQVLIDVIIDAGIKTKEELNDIYRLETINRMRAVREPREESLRRQRLGLPPSGLLGPNGQPL